MRSKRQVLTGWGRYPRLVCETLRPERYRELWVEHAPQLVRGQGRSYGDAALLAEGDGMVSLSERLNRILDFDSSNGVLRAEAGVTLAELLPLITARGWFLPVTPGTKFVSLGGCVASDVHGKNHHGAGSFAQHVRELELILADGRRLRCSPQQEAELFWATVGGMGLTGIIGEVSLQLIPIESAYMQVRHHRARNLQQAFELMQPGEDAPDYQVAWIDCLARGRHLGRSVVMDARHARADELSAARARQPLALKPAADKRISRDFPGWVLNPLSVRLFNAFYYWREGRRGEFISDYDRYFYPLDHIQEWNRMYGKRGFVQYQCVLPLASAHAGISELLQQISRAGQASFLSVLKRLGPANPAPLSFPMEGYTLALDLPLKGRKVLALLGQLDEVVIAHGGRVYLSKDARLSAESFAAMYPRLPEWRTSKRQWDPDNHFRSAMSQRLGIEHGS